MYLFRKDLKNRPEMVLNVPHSERMMCLNESSLDPFQVIEKDFVNKLKNEVHLNRYFNDVTANLKQKLSEYVGFGIKPEQLLFGNGADEMLYYLFTAVREDPYSFALAHAPSYFDYKTYCGSVGLQIRFQNLNEDFNFSVEDYIQIARDPNCKLAILCNPNNPTGHQIPDKKIIHILENVSIPVIIDETYFEFSNLTFANVLNDYPHLIIVRSFSKSFSSAGVRFGYIISSEENCREINKVMPFFHSSLMIQAFVLSLLEHKETFLNHNKQVILLKDDLYQKMNQIPSVKVIPTKTNFLLFSIGEKTPELFECLKDNGIAIRAVWAHPILKDYLRVTVSSSEDNEYFLDILKNFI